MIPPTETINVFYESKYVKYKILCIDLFIISIISKIRTVETFNLFLRIYLYDIPTSTYVISGRFFCQQVPAHGKYRAGVVYFRLFA